MKKLELSDGTSNLLLLSSVGLASLPFLLGDKLFPIVTGFIREGGVMVDQFFTWMTSLLS